MNARFNSDLLEATRLTRSGQLLEATALIQRALGAPGMPQVDVPAQDAGDILDGDCRVIDISPVSRDGASESAAPGENPTADEPRTEATSPASRFGAALRRKLFEFRGPLPTFDPLAPAQAPDALPDGARFVEGSYANAAGTRSYKLYVPGGERAQPLPLVVMLHGCTQNPDDFAAGTRMNELAEKEGCLVLYPAQSHTANGSKCWNWFKPSDQRSGEGEPSLIAGMTREIALRYKADPARIYVAGLSAGGAMATTMAVTYPDLYAAAGIHSGLPYAAAHDLPSALAAMQRGVGRNGRGAAGSRNGSAAARPVPIIVFHGDRDTTVHPRNGEQVVVQFSPNAPRGAALPPRQAKPEVKIQRGQVPDGRAYTVTSYHASGTPLVEQWTIHGAGHAWSGGSTRGSYTDPLGPDASKEMLRFFLAHPAHERTDSQP